MLFAKTLLATWGGTVLPPASELQTKPELMFTAACKAPAVTVAEVNFHFYTSRRSCRRFGPHTGVKPVRNFTGIVFADQFCSFNGENVLLW